MPYREEVPHPALAGIVGRISASRDVAPPPDPVRVLPDGGVDLLFSFPAEGGGCEAEVFGVKSRALLVHDRRPFEKIAVHLRPGVFARLFGVPAWELRDRVVRLEDLWPAAARLRERLAATTRRTDRTRRIESALLGLPTLARRSDPATRMERAVARLRQGEGRLPIRDLALELGLGVRTLERLFREHVGLPPKLYARIVRLHAAQRALRSGHPGAEAAAATGYSDQAHMSREIRALSGVPPTRL